jgi:hypothetical protein
VISLLNIFFQEAFKLFDELAVDFEINETMAELGFAKGYLEVVLSFLKLLLLNLDYLLNELITRWNYR